MNTDGIFQMRQLVASYNGIKIKYIDFKIVINSLKSFIHELTFREN